MRNQDKFRLSKRMLESVGIVSMLSEILDISMLTTRHNHSAILPCQDLDLLIHNMFSIIDSFLRGQQRDSDPPKEDLREAHYV